MDLENTLAILAVVLAVLTGLLAIAVIYIFIVIRRFRHAAKGLGFALFSIKKFLRKFD